MLYIKKFKDSAGFHDGKFDLPYPYLAKSSAEEEVFFGELFNIIYMYYNIPESGYYEILGPEFPLKNIQEMYVDEGSREVPVRSYNFLESGEHAIKFLMSRKFRDSGDMFLNVSTAIRTNLNQTNGLYSKLRYTQGMFSGCNLITSINLSKLDTSEVIDMSRLFKDCSSLSQVTMKYPVDKVAKLDEMFSGVAEVGTFYYNPEYDYTKIINILPPGWVAKELVSCYAAGYWINDQPWSNEHIWANG